jgi:hypothetical protein
VARPQVCTDKFCDALNFCELEDLGFEGDMFTWRETQRSYAGVFFWVIEFRLLAGMDIRELDCLACWPEVGTTL